MSKQSSRRGPRNGHSKSEPIRNTTRFVKAYLSGETGRKLLSRQVPKMALSFQAALEKIA